MFIFLSQYRQPIYLYKANYRVQINTNCPGGNYSIIYEMQDSAMKQKVRFYTSNDLRVPAPPHEAKKSIHLAHHLLKMYLFDKIQIDFSSIRF